MSDMPKKFKYERTAFAMYLNMPSSNKKREG